jgi:hypothetical protein
MLCSYAWKLHYVDHVETPTAPALAFGSAWHTLTEEYLKTGRPLGELWPEAWNSQLEREPNVDWSQDSPDSMRATGMQMINSQAVRDLLSNVRENFDPETCRVERRVELRVPGVPIPIIGYIDVITKDGIPGDFKTAARMWSDDKATAEMQPLVYLAALNQAGEHSHGWRFNHFVVTKASKPTARVFATQRTPDEVLNSLFPTICAVWKAIGNQVFTPNTTTWKHSPKYCEYWAACPHGGKCS